MNRLYAFVCRHDAMLCETLFSEEEVLEHFLAALDAASIDDIRHHKAAWLLPDTILDRMLELKEQRLEELARTRGHAPVAPHVATSRQDAEPEQGA